MAMMAQYDWSAVVPTLVGGGISAVSAVVMFYFAQRTERNRSDLKEAALASQKALSGYLKALEYVNFNANLNRNIEQSYEVTKSSGLVSDDAWSFVPSGIVNFLLPERLNAAEISFLLTKEGAELLSALTLIESRSINNQVIWMKYCELREAFESWSGDHEGIKRSFDGLISTSRVPDELKVRFNEKGSQLNNLLGSLVESLAQDIIDGGRALQAFVDIARIQFGDLFPELKIERVGKDKC